MVMKKTLKNDKKWIIGLVVVVLIAGFFAFKDIQKSQRITDTKQNKYVQYQGENEKSVFELLTQKHDVEYSQSDLGVFVESVDSLSNSDNEYWIYYIDGEMGMTAADKTITQNNQNIEWKYQQLTY